MAAHHMQVRATKIFMSSLRNYNIANTLGEEINEEFIERILNGHRLTKPVFSPSNIYELMQQCWSKRPTDRPTFSMIREVIEVLTPAITDISIKY